MKRITAILILLISVSFVYAEIKDFDAWKAEKSIEQQYTVFKKNLNLWKNYYYLSEPQLNQFFNAMSDTISGIKNEVLERRNQVKLLQNEINLKNQEIIEIQAKLENSVRNQNSVKVLGVYVSKGMYLLTMYILILAVLAFSGIIFTLFNRSNKLTKRIQADYNDLKQEFEIHKKNALERYVKINTELTKARFELNKK